MHDRDLLGIDEILCIYKKQETFPNMAKFLF